MANSTDYKTHMSGIFTRASTTYDQIGPPLFSYFGKKLVEFGALSVGSKVLDIACGRGAVLVPASEAVSDSGEVIGIDISEGMIDLVRKEIRRRKITNAKVYLMDAESLEFSDSKFDFILCGLCLFFFPDLTGALSEFYRVLKPGGFIIASTFKKPKRDEFADEWNELYKLFEDRVMDLPDVDISTLNTGRKIKTEMAKAGFNTVEVKTRSKTFYLQDEYEWWQRAWSQGYRAYLERIPSEYLPEFKTRAIEIIRKMRTERGIPFQRNLLFTRSQKPVDKKGT